MVASVRQRTFGTGDVAFIGSEASAAFGVSPGLVFVLERSDSPVELGNKLAELVDLLDEQFERVQRAPFD